MLLAESGFAFESVNPLDQFPIASRNRNALRGISVLFEHLERWHRSPRKIRFRLHEPKPLPFENFNGEKRVDPLIKILFDLLSDVRRNHKCSFLLWLLYFGKNPVIGYYHLMDKEGKIRILFFGTSDFAVPALNALAKTYSVAGVVTRPDERAGRKNVLTPPPVKTAAEELGVPVLQPERLVAAGLPHADVFVVAAYGKIISKEVLALPRLGTLNIHPSLLPRWRGPSPIQYAILSGDTETGVTIMSMDAEVDHGPIIASVKHSMFDKRYTYPQLHDVLARAGAELLIAALPRWITGETASVPQDHSNATYSKILTRDSGRIDWTKSAEEIERMVRAFHPWPGTWTVWTRGTSPLRMRIESADWTPDIPPSAMPGMIWQNEQHPLMAVAGTGSLIIRTLGIEGKTVTDADAFLRGHPKIIGSMVK